MQELRGLDLSKHKSTSLPDALEPPPDLILVMEERHLAITQIDPTIAGRTFTLKGFVRRTQDAGPRGEGESLPDYLSRVADSPFTPNTEDGIPDPIGLGLPAYQQCAAQLEELIEQLVDLVWPRAMSV